MSELDVVLKGAVETGLAPFIVAMVGDREGIRWSGAAGMASPTRPADDDTVFALFSMTKSIASLMAVIAMDRGILDLETPVGDVLPAFDDLQVLEAVRDGAPVFRKPKVRATLRHLLTHTSGMGYEAFYPLMIDYAAVADHHADVLGTVKSLNYPLLYDPGEGFSYGPSTDWVGAMIAEASGQTIDGFVRSEILEPLGMRSTYFERAEAGDRLARIRTKGAGGQFAETEMYPAQHPEIYHMGHALYASAGDYMRFLRLILNQGELDGTRIASRAAMQCLFEDQMHGVPMPTPMLTSSIQDISLDVELLPGVRKTHTAAFFQNVEAVPGGRSANSLTWSGVLNTHFWVDVERDVAAVFMTQMLPFCDPAFMGVYSEFEQAVYQQGTGERR